MWEAILISRQLSHLVELLELGPSQQLDQFDCIGFYHLKYNLIYSPIHLCVLLLILLYFYIWLKILHSFLTGGWYYCTVLSIAFLNGLQSNLSQLKVGQVYLYLHLYSYWCLYFHIHVRIYICYWVRAWCVFVLAAQRCLCLNWRSPKWTFRLVCLFQPEMLPDRYCFAMVKITKYKLQNAKYRMLSKRYCFAITSKGSNYIICLSQGSLSKGHVSSVLEIQIVIQEKYKFKYRERDCKSQAGNYIVCLSPR